MLGRFEDLKIRVIKYELNGEVVIGLCIIVRVLVLVVGGVLDLGCDWEVIVDVNGENWVLWWLYFRVW